MKNTYYLTPKITCMCFDKQRSIRNIKTRLQLANKWLEKTEDEVVIKYYLDGKMKFLTLDRDEVPRLLKEAGLIQRWEGKGCNRKMYKEEAPQVKPGNSFTCEWFENLVQCEEIKIYPSDVIHFIACREHDKIVELMKRYQMN